MLLQRTSMPWPFLDLFPLAFGHVLVIPKIEVNAIYEVPEPYYSAVWALVRQLAPAIQSAFPCRKVGMAVIGLEVPHAHVHLVPIERSRGAFLCSPQVAPSSGGIAGTCCAYPGVFEPGYDRLKGIESFKVGGPGYCAKIVPTLASFWSQTRLLFWLFEWMLNSPRLLSGRSFGGNGNRRLLGHPLRRF